METKTYRVDGMTCGGCAASVTKAILRADATAEVDVDLAKAEVSVSGVLDPAAVQSAVEGAGFDYLGLAEEC